MRLSKLVAEVLTRHGFTVTPQRCDADPAAAGLNYVDFRRWSSQATVALVVIEDDLDGDDDKISRLFKAADEAQQTVLSKTNGLDLPAVGVFH